MRFLVTLLILAMTVACSKSDEPQNTSEPKTEKQSSHDHEHDAAPATSLIADTYVEVAPQDQCEQSIVIEFFAYQCPHCYKLEEHAVKWQSDKPENVVFRSVPTDLGRQEFGPFLLIHLAAEKLGILDKIKPRLFAIIHEKATPFSSKEDLVKMFVEAGVEAEVAQKTLEDGEFFNQKLNENFELMKRYKITSVPSVLVNYQYQTDVTKAKGYDKVFNVVNDTLKLTAKCHSK